MFKNFTTFSSDGQESEVKDVHVELEKKNLYEIRVEYSNIHNYSLNLYNV